MTLSQMIIFEKFIEWKLTCLHVYFASAFHFLPFTLYIVWINALIHLSLQEFCFLDVEFIYLCIHKICF